MTLSQNFDWVTAVSECSIQKCYERLIAGIESDVAQRNEIAKARGEQRVFEISREGRNVLITRSGPEVQAVKVRYGPSITIESEHADSLRFSCSLNAEGECVLMRDGVEMQFWQVRKLALEALFFHG